ncbi:YggS family pyridoxal phosphate-dependent enzyme [soil metagenome]
MSRREELGRRLEAVEKRLAGACAAAGRHRAEVTLVAVTKTFPASDVRLLAELGVRDVGESRDQEAAGKAAACSDLSLRWHFVGQLQRNKARSVATYAAAVHSVDRPQLVSALDRAADAAGRSLDTLIQLDLDPHPQPGRGGAPPDGLAALADALDAAVQLRLVGLMAVAPAGADPAPAFARLAELAAALRRDHPGARWLSAGMSGDLEAAVAAGATHVRVGGALLGTRPPLR